MKFQMASESHSVLPLLAKEGKYGVSQLRRFFASLRMTTKELRPVLNKVKG